VLGENWSKFKEKGVGLDGRKPDENPSMLHLGHT
jgi:hypothetical protein